MTVLLLVAGVWSLALGVLGVWLIAEPHDGWLGDPLVSVSAGVVALCSAQLVFLVCAVDRVFPSPHRWIRSGAHLGNMLILSVSMGVLIMASLLAGV